MRHIFRKKARYTERAKKFVELLSSTHDSFGYSTETLCTILGCQPRNIRAMMELWNNFKYEDTLPRFKISKSKANVIGAKHLYRRIDITSVHRDRILLQAKLDKIEYILKDYYTRLILGEVNTTNQINVTELINEATKLMEEE